MTRPNIVLALTGASGAIYGVRLLHVLLAADQHVHLSISPSAQLVLKHELGLSVDLEGFRPESLLCVDESPGGGALSEALAEVLERGQSEREGAARDAADGGQLTYHHYKNLMSSIASGSFLTDGMVICPCSGTTLGAVVHGTGENLIHRAAGVHLKERRKLILVPRETPLSLVQLDNMRRAVEAGAILLPAMPGFYHGVRSIADLVDFVVARICDQLGIEHRLIHRWGESSG